MEYRYNDKLEQLQDYGDLMMEEQDVFIQCKFYTSLILMRNFIFYLQLVEGTQIYLYGNGERVYFVLQREYIYFYTEMRICTLLPIVQVGLIQRMAYRAGVLGRRYVDLVLWQTSLASNRVVS